MTAEEDRLVAENEALRRRIQTIEHGWSSPLGHPSRWAKEPIPFPRRRNDVYRVQSDYMRAIECSSNGPTSEERAEKVDQLVSDAMDLTYEVMHLRMTVATARAEIDRLKNAEPHRPPFGYVVAQHVRDFAGQYLRGLDPEFVDRKDEFFQYRNDADGDLVARWADGETELEVFEIRKTDPTLRRSP